MFEGLKPEVYSEVALREWRPIDLDRLYVRQMVFARVYRVTASLWAAMVYAYLLMSVTTGSPVAFAFGIPLTILYLRYCYVARAAIDKACDLAQLCDLDGNDC